MSRRQGFRRISGCGLALGSLTSCSRAPSFDILGSFFPPWLVCLAVGVLLTAAARWILLRVNIPLAPPILIYPSMTALVTFVLWFAFFR